MQYGVVVLVLVSLALGLISFAYLVRLGDHKISWPNVNFNISHFLDGSIKDLSHYGFWLNQGNYSYYRPGWGLGIFL
jgi:hypothetical protein